MAEVYVIKGKKAKSINEYNVSVVLDELLEAKVILGWDYEVPLRGGSHTAGGLRIDFLVYDPFPRPLECYEKYYHSGQLGANDDWRIAVIEGTYKRKVDILWSEETATIEKARENVRKLYAS